MRDVFTERPMPQCILACVSVFSSAPLGECISVSVSTVQKCKSAKVQVHLEPQAVYQQPPSCQPATSVSAKRRAAEINPSTLQMVGNLFVIKK